MKTVILCGGQGTRIRDLATDVPKPMIPVGDQPILWHVMKYYASFGYADFVLCLGHKGAVIKRYFLEYDERASDISLTLGTRGALRLHGEHDEAGWGITLAETGESALTGTRVRSVRKYLEPGEPFFLTYGDGVSDVDLHALLEHHKRHGKILTITGVKPPGRFGEIQVGHDGAVDRFVEKPADATRWISGGFFVADHRLFDYLPEAENVTLERQPMERLAAEGQIQMYEHHGFWQCMDTYQDYQTLNDLWAGSQVPWRSW